MEEKKLLDLKNQLKSKLESHEAKLTSLRKELRLLHADYCVIIEMYNKLINEYEKTRLSNNE